MRVVVPYPLLLSLAKAHEDEALAFMPQIVLRAWLKKEDEGQPFDFPDAPCPEAKSCVLT